MIVVDFIQSLNYFDLLVVVGLAFMFLLGFIQGTIRRLLGLIAILFSFLLASTVRDPLGTFLASHWHQFPPEYASMIGYLTVFVVGSVAFSLVIQGFYKPSPLFPNASFLDEILGGVLGVVEGLLILIAITIILSSTFAASPPVPKSDAELPFLRDFWNALSTSGTYTILQQTLIPAFFAVFGWAFSDDIRSIYPAL
ncbi:MAG TPA: CvpA family protein [Candidatus Limnocylindrales bacterium]